MNLKFVNLRIFNGIYCYFGYQLIQKEGITYVLIVEQPITNTVDRSATDASEEIATYVVQTHNLDYTTCIFIEYIPNNEFSKVTYKWLNLRDNRVRASHSNFKALDPVTIEFIKSVFSIE